MILPLLLSSFAVGLIATSLMAFVLYLPRSWGGSTYDIIGAVGSAIVGRANEQSRFMGTTAYFLVGILFSVLYGWVALWLMERNVGDALLHWPVYTGAPIEIEPLYPLIGAGLGLVHGLLVALFIVYVVVRHHPVEEHRSSKGVFTSQTLSHMVYGASALFFHHQFLQLLLGQ